MEKPRLTIELDVKLKREAKAKAYGEGTTLKGKIVELLQDWLKKK